MDLVGPCWVFQFRTHNELNTYLVGKWGFTPSVSSGLPSPELPVDFLLAIRRVLTSPYPMPSSFMLDLLAWSIDLGQASLELMFLLSLCWVRRLRLTHTLASRAAVQMADPGLNPVQAAEFHMADMLHTGDKDPYTQWAHCEHIVSTDNMWP